MRKVDPALKARFTGIMVREADADKMRELCKKADVRIVDLFAAMVEKADQKFCGSVATDSRP